MYAVALNWRSIGIELALKWRLSGVELAFEWRIFEFNSIKITTWENAAKK